MATLVNNIENIREHVTTAFNFTWENIAPYVKQTERQYIKTTLGSTLYNIWLTTPPTSGNTLEVYNLLCEASANIALLKYVPIGAVYISDTGILTVSTATTKPADWRQVNDLKRSLLEIGNTAIDEAFKIMESNEADFTGWSTTEGYTVFKELIVPKTTDFNRYFSINNSRQTFLALRGYQLEAQNQIFNWLDAETLALIKTANTTITKQALEYAQAAQVNHTVAKAAESSMFQFTATGLFTASNEMPYETKNKLDEPQILRLIKSRINTGDEFLKKLKTLITTNSSVFTSYTNPATTATVFVHNTSSIVAF